MTASATVRLRLWQGELMLGEDWAVWQGEVGDGQTHAHFAAQAVLGAAEGQVLDGEDRALSAGVALIEPMAPHRLMPGLTGSLIFLEPRARQHRLPAPWRDVLLAAVSTSPALPGAADGFWRHWPGTADAPAEGDWEAAVRSAIDAALPNGSVGLSPLAMQFNLSAERFRHRFAASLGLPLRRFVLWRRLHLAITRLQTGAGVTEAAMEAGFADAAHFGRTLKQNFGVSARQILR